MCVRVCMYVKRRQTSLWLSKTSACARIRTQLHLRSSTKLVIDLLVPSIPFQSNKVPVLMQCRQKQGARPGPDASTSTPSLPGVRREGGGACVLVGSSIAPTVPVPPLAVGQFFRCVRFIAVHSSSISRRCSGPAGRPARSSTAVFDVLSPKVILLFSKSGSSIKYMWSKVKSCLKVW